MKVLLLFLAALCFAGAHDSSLQLINFPKGKVFNYEYTALISAGIPDMSEQRSWVELQFQVSITPTSQDMLLMEFDEIKAARVEEDVFSPEGPRTSTYHHEIKVYARQLKKPVLFDLRDGKIRSYTVESSEPEWSINIKKSILEKLQLPINDQKLQAIHDEIDNRQNSRDWLKFFVAKEDGPGGLCEVYYHVNVIPSPYFPHSDNILNITKTWNFKKCDVKTSFKHHNLDAQGCPKVCRKMETDDYPGYKNANPFQAGCPFSYEPTHTMQKPYSTTKYNFTIYENSELIMSQFYTEHKISNHLHDQAIVLYIYQNMTLESIENAGIRNVQNYFKNPEQHTELISWKSATSNPYSIFDEIVPITTDEDEDDDDDLSPEQVYYGVFEDIDDDEHKNVFETLLESVVDNVILDELELSRTAAQKSIYLIKTTALLSKESLREVWDDIVDKSKLDEASEKELVKRKLFLDALSICGSSNATELVAELIIEEEVTPVEAHEMVIAVPKNIIYPTTDLIKVYKNLIESRFVTSHPLLFTQVHLTYGKLLWEIVRHSPEYMAGQLTERSDSKHYDQMYENLYDRGTDDMYSRDRIGNKRDDHVPYHYQQGTQKECSVIKQHIMDLGRKLEQTKDFRETITYIEALAHTKCIDALEYLEPYVTGDADDCSNLGRHSTDADCDFVRTVAVYALHHIARRSPKEVIPLAAEIYFNVQEPYELRIAAFSVLIQSKPTLTLLEKIATSLLSEPNNQVVSYVYSSLESLGNSSLPCFQMISTKIQHVFSQLDELEPPYHRSKLYMSDYYDEDEDFGVQTAFEYISSNVSEHFRTLYFTLFHNYGPYLHRPVELGLNVQGIDDLLDEIENSGSFVGQLFDYLSPDKPEMTGRFRDFANKLNIQDRDDEEFKATLFSKLFYETSYYIADKESMKYYVELVKDFVDQYFITANNAAMGHYVKLMKPATVHKAVAAEFGLPAVLSVNHPVIFSLKVKKFDFSYKQNELTIETVIHPTIHYTSHLSSYVINTADKYHYGAEVQKIYQFSLPVDITLTVDTEEDTYELSLKPRMPHEVLYHKTAASTFARSSSAIITKEEECIPGTYVIETIPNPFMYKKQLGHDTLGFGLTMDVSSEDVWSDIPFIYSDTSYGLGVFPALVEEIRNTDWTPREMRLWIDPNSDMEYKEYVMNFVYDYDDNSESPNTRDSWATDSYKHKPAQDWEREYEDPRYSKPQWNKMYDQRDRNPTYNKYQQPRSHHYSPPQFDKSVPYTMHNFTLYTTAYDDDEIIFSTEVTFHQSYDNMLNYLQIRKPDERGYEYCAHAFLKFKDEPSEFYLLKSYSGEAVLDAGLGWDNQCNQNSQIKIRGILETDDDDLLPKIFPSQRQGGQGGQYEPWYYQQCEEDKRDGQSQSYACELAIAEECSLNKLTLNVTYSSVKPYLLNITRHLEQAAKAYFYPNMDIDRVSAKNSPNSVDVEVEWINTLPDAPITNVYIYKPNENLFFEKVFNPYVKPLSTLMSYMEVYQSDLTDYMLPATCSIMEDYVRTFDNVTYELPEHSCEYLLAYDCSSDRTFGVAMKQDPNSKQKDIEIQLGKHSIRLEAPTHGDVSVIVDGSPVHIPQERPLIIRKEDPIYISLSQPSDRSSHPEISIEDTLLGVEVTYDGVNIEIEVEESYQGMTCGLCGDYNDEEIEEFTGPANCIYEDSTDFANSYIVNRQSCNSPQQPQFNVACPNKPNYQKPWRSTGNDDRSRYPKCSEVHTHVKEDRDQICFSKEPVKHCLPGCQNTGMKQRKVPFHCLPKESTYAYTMKDQAQKRFIHEIAQKPTDAYYDIVEPNSCINMKPSF